MVEEVILHIGAPKTATTSIQKTLVENLNALENNNILIPKGWRTNNGGIMFSCFSRNSLDFHIHKRHNRSIEDIEIFNEYNLNILESNIKNSDATSLLISGEAMFWLGSDEIEDIKVFFEEKYNIRRFRIIAFVRNPISYWVSDCQQIIRDETYTYESFSNRPEYNVFEEVITKYGGVFGSEYVEVYPFEAACSYKSGPVDFFFQKVLKVNDEINYIEAVNSNPSSSDRAIDLIRYINKEIPLFTFEKGNPISKGRFQGDLLSIKGISGKKYMVDKPTLERIWEMSRQDSEFLKSNYGIDYCNKPITDTYEDLSFDDQYILDISECYNDYSDVVKKLVYNYVVCKQDDERLSDESKCSLNYLQKWIEINYSFIVDNPVELHKVNVIKNIKLQEEKFSILAERLNSPDTNMSKKNIAIALFLEQNELYDSAFFYISKAKRYVQHEQTITTITKIYNRLEKLALNKGNILSNDSKAVNPSMVDTIVDNVIERKTVKYLNLIREYGLVKSIKRILHRK